MDLWMKAAVLHHPGDLRIERVKITDQLDKDEVLVKIMSAGICGSDIERIMKIGTYRLPMIPGHEFCGMVEKTGDCVEAFKAGDRVIVVPIRPCFQCEFCQHGDYGQCEKYDYYGSRRDGGFAQYLKVSQRNLIPMPDEISFEEGALVEPAAVTLHGIRKIGIQAGDSVAVLGCGAIGQFAIQYIKILGGIQVVAIDIDADKLAIAKELGADFAIDSSTCDPVQKILALTNDKGVHVTVETAGVAITQEQCIRMTKYQGRILFVGTAHKDVVFPPKTFERIVRGELQLSGTWNSYSAPFPGVDWTATIAYIQSGALKVQPMISHIVPLEEAPGIIKDMLNRKINYTKVVIKMNKE